MSFNNGHRDHGKLTPEEKSRLSEETQEKIVRKAIAGDEASIDFLESSDVELVIERTTTERLGYRLRKNDRW